MSRRCGAFNCPKDAHTRGFCEPHYRRRLATRGQWGFVDPAPVLAHIAALRALGWTWQQIGDAAGIAHSTPHGLWMGRYRRLRADSARALLAVPVGPARSHRGIDSCGTRRRVQALSWMGWPTHEVARRAGIPPATLRTLVLPTRRISREYAARVAEVYEQLSHVPGPSRTSMGKARHMGFAPPAAWDDDTIDDPAAVPEWGEQTAGVAWDEVAFLRSQGLDDGEIAARLGVARSTVRDRRGRDAA